MATNIEIKTRIVDYGAMREMITAIADTDPELLIQKDIFYNVPGGRLKLRNLPSRQSELIYYERPDNAGPKTSEY